MVTPLIDSKIHNKELSLTTELNLQVQYCVEVPAGTKNSVVTLKRVLLQVNGNQMDILPTLSISEQARIISDLGTDKLPDDCHDFSCEDVKQTSEREHVPTFDSDLEEGLNSAHGIEEDDE